MGGSLDEGTNEWGYHWMGGSLNGSTNGLGFTNGSNCAMPGAQIA